MEISKSLMNWPILSMLEPEFISNIDMVVVHGDSGSEALIMTHDKMVYALGRNKYGCYGSGNTQCSVTPVKVVILCSKDIKTFAHGSSSYVLALTEDGQVYSWGNNNYYQLGNKFCDPKRAPRATLVHENLSDTFVVDIACGNFHSLALTGDGEVKWPKLRLKSDVTGKFGCAALIVTKDGIVYGLGENKSGCLGTGDTCSTFCPTEIKVLSGKGIKTFAYTEDQTLALTEKGEVYSWGCRYGNIDGYEPTSQDLTPTLVEGYPSEAFFVDVACGKSHSLALTNDGKVYAWGKNTYGQVDGSKSAIKNVSRMVGVKLPGKKIVYIRCCSESSMAVTDGGEVYSWGCNSRDELGRGDSNEAIGVHKVQIPTEVVIEKIACGQSHTLALSNEGVLYGWGHNDCRQLASNNQNNICTPIKLQVAEMGRVLDVAASPFDNISVAICEHGRVFARGYLHLDVYSSLMRTPFECLHDAFAHLAMCSVMHQPLIVYSEEEMSIADNLRQAFDDVATSDLTIHVDGKSIYVHKAILKLRSQYFRTIFQEHCAENNQSVIKHEQFCYNVYRTYLEYLYTDEINIIHAENIYELLDLAVTYFDSVLRDRCIPLSKSVIKVDNAATIYSISIKHDLEELEQFCLTFIVSNLSTVVETLDFSKLDEFTIKTLIIKAVKRVLLKDKL